MPATDFRAAVTWSSVISLCPLAPMEGTPSDKASWQSHFLDLCIEHFAFPHRDTRNLRGEDLRVEVASLRALWGQIFYHAATDRWRIQRGSGHLHSLFHCFAGINRSTAAAMAFVMQECNLALRVSIEKLCQVRPGQEYWRERDPFLLALLRLNWIRTSSSILAIRSILRQGCRGEAASSGPWIRCSRLPLRPRKDVVSNCIAHLARTCL